MWTIVARRVLFVLALLLTGALSTICFHCTINNRTGSAAKAYLYQVGHFAWGADSLLFLLALWLAGRKDVWNNWRGWLRAALYLAAFVYGQMLHAATQDWFYQARIEGAAVHFPDNAKPFLWPGTIYEHYGRPAIDILEVLIATWVLMPIFAVSRRRLAEREEPSKSSCTITTIFAWTALVGLIITWVKFITWEGVAPDTYFSGMAPEAMFRMYLYQYVPSMAISALVVWLIAWGWSGNRWLTLIVLFIALPLDAFAHRLMVAAIRWLGKNPGDTITVNATLEQWSYLSGRVAVAWSALGIAKALGVQLRTSSPRDDFENAPPKPT